MDKLDVLLKMDYLFTLSGIILLFCAYFTVTDASNPKRYTSAFFWGAYGLIFIIGNKVPPIVIGCLVLAMVVVAGINGVAQGKSGLPAAEILRERAIRLGNKLFIPALAIPVVTIICALLLKDWHFGSWRVFPYKSETLAGLGVACIIALVLALGITKDKPMQSIRESRRLIEAMGWAVLLPQLLAVLGIIFTDAGVGKAISFLSTEYMAVDNRLIAVAAYCTGMALFTMIMGNAFAAFPVITAGIGIPILITQHGANPAIICAIGMFSGYCGTLMTPMAANFNIVPAALLALEDKNAVIKAQVGTAIPLLLVNIMLMYFLAFR